MDKTNLNELLYINKDYSGIKELLKDNTELRSFNILGKIALWSGNINEAYNLFNKAGNIYGCCYCKFLNGNLNESEILLKLIKDSSPAVNWLLCITNVIKNLFEEHPTYFQIRSFYEQDLSMLFFYNQKNSIERILNNISFFETYNREIYKYSARVLMINNIYDTAEQMLNKSLNIFFKDPETHYILGEIYQIKKEYEKAKKEYKKSIEVNKGYYPAEKKLKDLMIV